MLPTGGQVVAQFVDGIDVSHWQGTINWTSVKNSGVEFAFMKATQGNGYVDPTFHTNIRNATAAGVLVGPYHFCDVDTDSGNPLDPVNEANNFLSQIEPYYNSGLYLRLDSVAHNPKGSLLPLAGDFDSAVEVASATKPWTDSVVALAAQIAL